MKTTTKKTAIKSKNLKITTRAYRRHGNFTCPMCGKDATGGLAFAVTDKGEIIRGKNSCDETGFYVEVEHSKNDTVRYRHMGKNCYTKYFGYDYENFPKHKAKFF